MEQAVRGDAASMLSRDQPLTRCQMHQPTRRDGAGHGSGQLEGYNYPRPAERVEVAAKKLPDSCDLDPKL